ncbi:MAG: radical SAM family heme chaperone HemW [Clostridia bacterium]|nr:radical SAM family heme chaperone HemW [Clostridia bacterium]
MKGLYIHIPFCIKKCNYCDFASYPSLISKSNDYISAMLSEMKLYKGEKIDTVYFGGGTPTVLQINQLQTLISFVFSNFRVLDGAEITIEVNPCTINKEKAIELRKMGFNRVSLGAQSFLNDELKLLGRLHTSDDTISAYKHLSDAGFNNISLDLMYALPNQTNKSLSTSIEQMLKLKPNHISCYGLKIEDGTPFSLMEREGKIKEKSDDEYADMYEIISKNLLEAGYKQYELSNFSLPGYESKHNIKYWTLGEYIGIGLGASSYYKGKRYTRTYDFDKYLESFENAEEYELSLSDKMSEYMFLSLRLTKRGALKKEFASYFGKEITDVFPNEIKKHVKTGMLLDLGDRYILSKKAYYISNSVLCDFV